MAASPPRNNNDRDQARQARLRQALRDNLKKRKAQLRGRADLAATEAGVSSEPDSGADDRSRQDEPERE